MLSEIDALGGPGKHHDCRDVLLIDLQVWQSTPSLIACFVRRNDQNFRVRPEHIPHFAKDARASLEVDETILAMNFLEKLINLLENESQSRRV